MGISMNRSMSFEKFQASLKQSTRGRNNSNRPIMGFHWNLCNSNNSGCSIGNNFNLDRFAGLQDVFVKRYSDGEKVAMGWRISHSCFIIARGSFDLWLGMLTHG